MSDVGETLQAAARMGAELAIAHERNRIADKIEAFANGKPPAVRHALCHLTIKILEESYDDSLQEVGQKLAQGTRTNND